MVDKTKIREKIGVDEFKDKSGQIWKAFLAEFFGNLLLNLFGCGSCVDVVTMATTSDVIRIAFTFGLVIFAIVQSLGHVSGGHFNPAVTFAFLCTGRVPVLRGFIYIIIQCTGAICGSAILKAFLPKHVPIQDTLGLTVIHEKLTAAQAFGVEFFLGFILVMVVFGVSDINRPYVFIPGPLAVGLTIAAGHLFAVPLTGSGMNPARAFGSAVIVNKWTDHWVYWAGPILGGLVAGLIYFFLFSAPETDEYTPVRKEDRA